MANFDYMAEFGHSADELREVIAELSEQTGKQKREIWHAFITYASKDLDDLKAWYAKDIERKRLMDAGKALFVEVYDDNEANES